MQSRRRNATSLSPRIATEGRTDIGADHQPTPDTRRFATIFPLEVLDATSIDSNDTTQEEQNDSDDLSRFKFVAALDGNPSPKQAASLSSVHQNSTISAAQHVIACYRAVHDNNHSPQHELTETGNKELPQLPEDRRSVYTLPTSTGARSSMDMMWRPKPKVHMHRADQRALVQAQSQAIAMMHDAGLKPTNKIQCRRRGCADILPDVGALKYHLHIHNIADSATESDGTSQFITRNSPPECGTSKAKTLKRYHIRSKSSLGTHRRCFTTSPLPRKLSAGSLLPSLFSPRECTPEALTAPSFTTIVKAFTADASPNKPTGSPSARNDVSPSTRTSTPSRGRKKRKESISVSVGAEGSPTIAMLLSPPLSPVTHDQYHPALTPRVKLPTPILYAAKDTVNKSWVSIPNESEYPVSEELTRSRSPVRALSPTRAMSPIRDGIKRILSIGTLDNVLNK